MVGVTAASTIFAIILTSGVAIYRSCLAADDYSYQTNEQMRSLDYVSRDLRNATAVTTPSGGSTLTLTMPDYYPTRDPAGIPTSAPSDPVIVDGAPVYGDATQPVTVDYYVSGADLIRQQYVAASAQTTRLIIASEVSTFTVSFLPFSTVAKISIAFAPRPHPGITALRPGSTITATVAARMLRVQ